MAGRFTASVLEHFTTRDLEIHMMLRRIGKEVFEKSKGSQEPVGMQESNRLIGLQSLSSPVLFQYAPRLTQCGLNTGPSPRNLFAKAKLIDASIPYPFF